MVFLAAVAAVVGHVRKPAPTNSLAHVSSLIPNRDTQPLTDPKRGERPHRDAQELQQQLVNARTQWEHRLEEADAKYRSASNESNRQKGELAVRDAQIEQLNRELLESKGALEQNDKLLENFETRLQQTELRLEQERLLAGCLERKLQAAEQQAVHDEPLRNDFDSRSVLGARDLHIVDVYDVDGSGKTQRTYGRVFYIEKKLLVFYAFDLQDKKRNRAVGGFQAWGYRQPDSGRPRDLGLFTIEDAKVNRWVLTVNDSRILQRIDAVFVTAEPPGGSPSPRGRKVLYANLAGPPNHP